MKNILFTLLISSVLYSCASFRSVDMGRLQMGMTKNQVKTMFGVPDRILFAGVVNGGYEEVLQYTTLQREVYALTFFNDYLESYGFLSEDVPINNNRPPHVVRPITPPQRPNNNNGNSNRPPSNSGRPDGNNRPNGRPNGNQNTDRPTGNQNNQRPSDPSGGSRPSGRSIQATETRSTEQLQTESDNQHTDQENK